ncbi:MAG: tetratricopeptide repeat protein [Pseudomonadota bacterium]
MSIKSATKCTLHTTFLVFALCNSCTAYAQTESSEDPQNTAETAENTGSDDDAEIESFIHNDYFQSLETPKFERPEEAVEQRIKALESLHGAFHASISEELLLLGQIYNEQEKHELAYDTFKRSLEIHRKNSGLHDIGQFPIVRQLIWTSNSLGDWKKVDRYYKYLYWLHRRLYDSNSPEMLPILDDLIVWKMQAINKRLFGDPEKLFAETRRAVRTYNEVVEINPELGRAQVSLRVWNNSLQIVAK